MWTIDNLIQIPVLCWKTVSPDPSIIAVGLVQNSAPIDSKDMMIADLQDFQPNSCYERVKLFWKISLYLLPVYTELIVEGKITSNRPIQCNKDGIYRGVIVKIPVPKGRRNPRKRGCLWQGQVASVMHMKFQSLHELRCAGFAMFFISSTKVDSDT